jgi:FkbM family methyltransferase
MPAHHPVFGRFRAFTGRVPTSFRVGFVGDRERNAVIGLDVTRASDEVATGPPPFNEEYFEWIDLLEAVEAAGDTFTMLELGAGYGRWSSRGALAARQRRKAVCLGVVEAEPKHVGWLKEHLADNGIAEREYRLTAAPLAREERDVAFCVSVPNGEKHWFGQAALRCEIGNAPVVGDYHGHALHRIPGGAGVIALRSVRLSDVLAPFALIDIVDMDVQGCEVEIIAEAIGPLTRKARRMHIGTHGPEIEADLRPLLSAAGWIKTRDWPCRGDIDTEYGRIFFQDGVQSWINPRVA